jgi:7-carboxy-7-deazaguanine synthase
MESNGTRMPSAPVDWLTVSPKPRFHEGRFQLAAGVPVSELKVVVDDTVDADVLATYEQRYPCELRFVQPCMDDRYAEHLQKAIALATARPQWRLSLQLHKIIDVP